MATNFPTSLDAFTNPVSSDTLDNPPHDQQHADVNDAMEAVQAKLGVGAHTIGEWTSFTPVFTNVTVGDGTVDAVYCQINDIVFVNGRFNLGSTSAITGGIVINHPPAGNAQTPYFNLNSQAAFIDGFATWWNGSLMMQSTNVVLYVMGVSASKVTRVNTSATSPHTWASGDAFTWSYFYRKA